MAMNANRMLNITASSMAKSTEKLSSGYKINRAADDAAGLAISEKMRRQVRGLTQATANAMDGVSMVQIADGAMAEIHDMMHRCTELSIKAANEILTAQDREYIQQEIRQLIREIDSVSQKTNFNEMKVLLGEDSFNTFIPGDPGTPTVVYSGSMPGWVGLGSAGVTNNMSEVHNTTKAWEILDSANNVDRSGPAIINHPAAILDFSLFEGTPAQIAELDGNGFHFTCCTCSAHYSVEFFNGTGNSREVSGVHIVYKVGIQGLADADELIDAILSVTTDRPEGHYTLLEKVGDNLIIYDGRSLDSLSSIHLNNGIVVDEDDDETFRWDGWDSCFINDYGVQMYLDMGMGRFGEGVARTEMVGVIPDEDIFHPRVKGVHLLIGSEADQRVYIELPNMSSRVLGIENVDVSTVPGALNGIDVFKTGMTHVSRQRSNMGAWQNRLEHTISNLKNVVENTTAAESAIRDTDMATEMVKFSLNNILSQAGQAMLSQANQANQGVLSLLQ